MQLGHHSAPGQPPASAKRDVTRCEVLAGDGSRGSAWLDGDGRKAHFTRPHDMVLLPGAAPRLLLSDIDNRALRVVALDGARRGATSSVIYDDDDALARRVGDKARESARPAALQGEIECAAAAANNTNATWWCARDVCAARGQRLCAPRDFHALVPLRSESSQRSRRRTLRHDDKRPKTGFWSAHACHSCWMKNMNQ